MSKAPVIKIADKENPNAKPITEETIHKFVKLVNAGLVDGGYGTLDDDEDTTHIKPGEMCVEEAVTRALDLPFNDQPFCVSVNTRALKISLNDDVEWRSDKHRGQGLKRLGIAQLGTHQKFNDEQLIVEVMNYFTRLFAMELYKAGTEAEKHLKKDSATDDMVAAAILFKPAARHLYNAPSERNVTVLRDVFNFSSEFFQALDELHTELQEFLQRNEVEATAGIINNFADYFGYSDNERVRFYEQVCEDMVQILVALKAEGVKFLHLTKPPKPFTKHITAIE